MFVFPFVRVKEAKRDGRGSGWGEGGRGRQGWERQAGTQIVGKQRTESGGQQRRNAKGSDGAEGASARGSGAADGRKGSGA